MNKLVTGAFAYAIVALTLTQSAFGQINIPLQTWVARPLVSPVAPCLGGCKHMRLTHNPVNGLIYVLGGDHTGTDPGHSQSGRNEMYTYSVKNDEWRLEQPYCRSDGTPQPSGPDEVGWVYDTRRNLFWMSPGGMWDNTAECPNTNLVRGQIMSYNPTTKIWTVENRTNISDGAGVSLGNAKFAQYDPVEDTILVFYKDQVNVYDIQNDTWTRIGFGMDLEIVGNEWTARDLDGRKIYIVENRFARHLYEYDMDAKSIKDLGPLPASAVQIVEQQAHWDPINKVVLWALWWGEDAEIQMLYVYHPETAIWEEIPIVHPPGTKVAGRQSVFDPNENVLLVMGPKVGNSPVFLYRYGNGSDIRPSPPTNLQVQ